MDRYAQLMISGEHFEMAPLSDFIVTERKARGALPKVYWEQWRSASTTYQQFDVRTINGQSCIVMRANRPTDVEVELDPEYRDDYELVWADDPDPV